MSYIKHYSTTGGFTKSVTIGDGEIKLTEFGIINLKEGEEYSGNTGGTEIALVVLGGKCSVNGDGFDFSTVGGRKDVFSGKPHTVYISCGRSYKITAVSNVEIAWIASPSDAQIDSYLIAPEQVKEVHLGKENYQRDAYMILTDNFPSQHFFIGEAFVPSGNHASYPPHRHDYDNLPVEVDMEEIYFFRFSPEQGYGIQKIYTDDRDIDFTYTIRHNDITLLPRGYHPVINVPGYTMYYLWIMSGTNHRKFLSVSDPDHQWVTGK